MVKETVITRWETINVVSAEQNEYKDLIVKSVEGKSYKVGNKRSGLFGLFLAGKTVKVGYAVYMNKEYIAVASQVVTEQFPEALQPSPESLQSKTEPPKEAKELGGKVAETIKTFNESDIKIRTMTLAYAKDLAVAGKIEVSEITMKAEMFYLYAISGKLK